MAGSAARTLTTAGVVSAVLALAACSEAPGDEAVTSTVTVQAEVSTPGAGPDGASGQPSPDGGGTGSPGASSPSPSASAAAATPSAATSAAPKAGPVEGAPSFAGGPAPAGAGPVPTLLVSGQRVSAFRTKTGNMGCDFSAGYAGCGIKKYIQQPPPGVPVSDLDPNWWVDLRGSGVPRIGPRGDAPYFTYPGAQILPYGQVVTYGDIVCASESDGLTCWNSTTGHGAFMSRDYYRPF
ncbi:hypothetical protein ACQP1U_04915 [Actinomycetota bacterium]